MSGEVPVNASAGSLSEGADVVCNLARKVEVCVQLGEFINIDIYRRGTYQIKVKLEAEHPHLQTKVGYVWGFQSPEDSSGTFEWKTTWINGSKRSEKAKSNSFRCPPFFIQHQDERALLMCGAIFQILIYSTHDSDTFDFEDYGWLKEFKCLLKVSLYYTAKNVLGREIAKGLNLLQTRTIRLPESLFEKGLHTAPKYTSVRFDGINFSALDVLFSALDIGDTVILRQKGANPISSSSQMDAKLIKSVDWGFWTRQLFQSNKIDNTVDKSTNVTLDLQSDKVLGSSSQISSMLDHPKNRVGAKAQGVVKGLRRQCSHIFLRMKKLFPRFLESLNREYFLEIFQQRVDSKYKHRPAEVDHIENELEGIKGWLRAQLEEASTFDQLLFENSLEALRLSIFEEEYFENSNQLSPIVNMLDIMCEMLQLFWKLLLSQTIEEGGYFVSMTALRNFRIAWAQIVRKKYIHKHVSHPEDVRELFVDLEEYEALGNPQFYGVDHCFECQVENTLKWKRPENGSNIISTSELPMSSISNNITDGAHLFVYVHGFLGASTDLKVYKNQMKYFHTFFIDEDGIVIDHGFSVEAGEKSLRIYHLMSESNEEKTDKLDISQMGGNLALEISDFISQNSLVVSKLSFICHSLGGLIARSALQHPILRRYESKLELFQTFSTPHASLSMSSNTLFNSGLSVLQTFQTSPALEQMRLQDKLDLGRPITPLLVSLSKDPCLGRFKTVRFFGSDQDGYTPRESACVCYSVHADEISLSVDENLKLVREIQRNIKSTILSGKTMVWESWNVNFKTLGKSSKYSVLDMLDTFVGRKAHIAMLDDHMLADIVIILNGFHI